MAEPIGVGDWVEFFRSYRGYPVPAESLVRLGEVYQVAGLVECVGDGGEPIPAFHLEGREPFAFGLPAAYPQECFRPISGRRASVIQALKAPPKRAPKRQREDA